ncbi:MAG TPA: hypothetical protein VNZ43_03545 [Sphingomonadaceae bacterium]|nr:hypothetical protein [Sphingomonadaceae bacterium]
MITFNFAIDGVVDMMSINPLEMSNFEATGAIFGVAGVILTLLWNHYVAPRKQQLPHVFIAQETEEDALD